MDDYLDLLLQLGFGLLHFELREFADVGALNTDVRTDIRVEDRHLEAALQGLTWVELRGLHAFLP